MILTPPLEGLLLDFDGLILDTETPIFSAWQERFRQAGQELLLQDWAVILGRSGQDLGPIGTFLSGLGDEALQRQVYQEVTRREGELVSLQQPLPGAVELIQEAKKLDLKLGIVSSSDRDWVHRHLERFHLLDYFDHTSCFDDVEQAKPDPELYLLGLKKMGAAPDKVLVLEDSPNGVLAAKRAGLYCIAVPNDLTKQLPFTENGGVPDRVLESLLDFPWDEVMKGDR